MEIVMEFIRLYLPTITATIVTVVIPLVSKAIVTKKFTSIESKLSESIKQSNIEDIRKDIAAIRDELDTMRGKPPKRGKQ